MMAKGMCEMSLADSKAEHLVSIVKISLACLNICKQRQMLPRHHCYCLSIVIVYDLSISKLFMRS